MEWFSGVSLSLHVQDSIRHQTNPIQKTNPSNHVEKPYLGSSKESVFLAFVTTCSLQIMHVTTFYVEWFNLFLDHWSFLSAKFTDVCQISVLKLLMFMCS